MINEEIKKYTKYFNLKSRDSYYVMMKVEACRRLKRETNFTLSKIAQIVLKDKRRHDTVLHYLNNYKEPFEYSVFIEENFDRFINEMIHPISVRHSLKRKPMYDWDDVKSNGFVNEHFTTFVEKKLELCL